MPELAADDGVKLHYEEAGSGSPIVFVHEFAGDARSWEPQLRHFSRRYRCIAHNARGYPPSDVPEDVERYSQARARATHPMSARCPGHPAHARRGPVDGRLRHAALRLPCALAHGRGRRLRRAPGAIREVPGRRARQCRIHPQGRHGALLRHIWPGPTRVQSQHKDPRGFDEYIRQLSDHSVTGSANTLSWTAKVAFASPPAHFAHMIDVYDWANPERVERCGVP
jgi:hypothetical protein